MKKFLIILFSFLFYFSTNAKIVDWNFNQSYKVENVLFFDKIINFSDAMECLDDVNKAITNLTVDTRLEIKYLYIYKMCFVYVINAETDESWVLGCLNNVTLRIADDALVIIDADKDIRLIYCGAEINSVIMYYPSYDVFPSMAEEKE